MRIQILTGFVVVAVETESSSRETGNLLFREEEHHAMPRMHENFELDGTMHAVILVEYRAKRSTTPKHCQVIIRVNQTVFAALKRDNTWRNTVYEALKQGIV